MVHIVAMEEQRIRHTPVMLAEVCAYLQPKPGQTVIDATLGMAGHSAAMLERIGPTGRLIGIDRDKESLEIARQRLGDCAGRCSLVHANFADIDAVCSQVRAESADAILMDLGLSSFQLLDGQRGFSFQLEGPLDMRMDRSSYISAYDLLNNLNEDEISSLLWSFGQERWHNRIARSLVQERQKHPIATTQELSEIVVRAIPGKYRHFHYRIHPATRTFQAVRIAVNRELEALEIALRKAINLLAPDGRLCVISFHSLEDRVVKWTLRKAAAEGQVEIVTPKPLLPSQEECRSNPPSRSAKMRVCRKI